MAKISLFGKRRAEPKPFPPPPNWWMGSLPEWNVYHALIRLGLKANVDFTYQSPMMGGRLAKGGAVMDFYFPSLNLAINIQSRYYHYATTLMRTADALQRAQLESLGIRVVFILEEDALRDPTFYTREALRGVDHSRLM